MLREACRRAAEWQRNSPPREKPLALNINLSGRQLQFPEVVDDIAQALEESGLPPSSAEGVEDSAQFLVLRRMGCDVGQGYYFGRPMDSGEISRLLGDDIAPPAKRPATTG